MKRSRAIERAILSLVVGGPGKPSPPDDKRSFHWGMLMQLVTDGVEAPRPGQNEVLHALLRLLKSGDLDARKWEGFLGRYEGYAIGRADEGYDGRFFFNGTFQLCATENSRVSLEQFDEAARADGKGGRPKPPAVDALNLHPAIESISGALYRDGHYKQAAQEAFVFLINEVKRRSELDLDGDRLMNRAFGCDGQAPVLRFNALQSEAQRDEQRGIMNLFKGVVGLRNFKAHTTTLFDDPARGFEYLALASLLLRLLEIAQKQERD